MSVIDHTVADWYAMVRNKKLMLACVQEYQHPTR